MRINTISNNQLIFLGTGGGRFTVFNQIRKSGGIWFKINDKLFAIDPGPGALIESLKHRLNPAQLSGIFISHRHLDHCADINSIIEAMTEGGHVKRGTVLAPYDATEEDPVILRYNRKNFTLINTKAPESYLIDGVRIDVRLRHRHTVETYGAVFGNRFSYIADTAYFDDLPRVYDTKLVIANVVFFKRRSGFKHLSVDDIYLFLEVHKPELLIITHFGLSFLRAKPWEVAKEISDKTGCRVVAAYDGMVVGI